MKRLAFKDVQEVVHSAKISRGWTRKKGCPLDSPAWLVALNKKDHLRLLLIADVGTDVDECIVVFVQYGVGVYVNDAAASVAVPQG